MVTQVFYFMTAIGVFEGTGREEEPTAEWKLQSSSSLDSLLRKTDRRSFFLSTFSSFCFVLFCFSEP